MSSSLPDRPDVEQLRRQAKELRDAARQGAPGAVARFARHYQSGSAEACTLAAAQLVIARELGFVSWPRLKAEVEHRAVMSERRVEAFVTASLEGRSREAVAMLASAPTIASQSLEAASVLGDSQQVAKMLAADPASAVATDDRRGWPPLLYVCYSRWHQLDAGRAMGMAEVARLLLTAGANPNTNNGARVGHRSALKGAVEGNNPDLTRVLLEAGANPDDRDCLGEAACCRDRDHRCLELLLSHGARVAGTWAVDAAVDADDPYAVSLLLGALQDGTGKAAEQALEALPEAAAHASAEVVAALLAAGADPAAAASDGFSALRCAVRAGKSDTAALLMSRGAPDDSTDIDRFMGACLRADRSTAEELMREHPDLLERLTAAERTVIVDVAGSAPVPTVELMLALGFSPDARNGLGEQPLHSAAYFGNADVVRLLIDTGAEVDARDTRFDSTPLAFATVGSGERAGKVGDWIETVRLLIDAGASDHGVWIADKPPSEEVIDLLRSHHITPGEPDSPSDDEEPPPGAIGTGVMAAIAEHLEAAYRALDLDLLGSLLHPDVRWTGLCSNRAEVLDWYRQLLAGGTQATVETVEVDRDAVVMGIRVAGRAEGTRPAPAERVFQVFTVSDEEVIEIRGYPNRQRALDRV